MKRAADAIADVQACILCGGLRHRRVFRKDPWQYLRCSGCGLVQLTPRPCGAGLQRQYDAYLSPDPVRIAEWERMTRPVVRASARLLADRHNGRQLRLLDIGCGYGFFMAEMKLLGWQTDGIEWSPVGRSYARRKFDIRVFDRSLETLNLREASYDAVTLFYVIEHLADPVSQLKRVRQLLRPDGTLMIRWPHTTPIVRLLGPAAKYLDLYHTPYHLFDFNPGTVVRLLQTCGFEEIRTLACGHTRPPEWWRRWPAAATGVMETLLQKVTRRGWLVPGTSKTTVARVAAHKRHLSTPGGVIGRSKSST